MLSRRPPPNYFQAKAVFTSRMTRKLFLAAAASLLLMAATFQPRAYCRVVSSAKSVGCYIQELQGADSSMNPVERVLFSLALADSNTPPAP